MKGMPAPDMAGVDSLHDARPLGILVPDEVTLFVARQLLQEFLCGFVSRVSVRGLHETSLNY
jgi:hypothetical protein